MPWSRSVKSGFLALVSLVRALPFLAALVACGGPGSFQGTVGGLTLGVKESVFITMKSNGQVVGLAMIMADQPGMCDLIKAGRVPKNTTTFSTLIGEADAQGNAVLPTAGTFPNFDFGSQQSKFSLSGIGKTDANCQTTTSASASSGSVIVNAYKAEAGGSMTGTFDLTFPNSETGKGSFDADFCDAAIGTGNTCT